MNKQENFYNWLVGMVDRDGCFSIDNNKGKWNLIFKIRLSHYNLRALYYIKTQLKIGSITVEKNTGMANFIITDENNLEKIVFPIFDKYQMLTSKQFNYEKFKKAHDLLKSNLDKTEKNFKLVNLLEEKMPLNYISTIWNKINNELHNFEQANKIVNKSWLIGFVEAAGNFYLVNKEQDRIVHGFGISIIDSICLEAIRKVLHIKTKIVLNKQNYYRLETTNSKAIENIISYFENQMKGMKAVEYKIWAKSYIRDKGNFSRLKQIRENYFKLAKNNA